MDADLEARARALVLAGTAPRVRHFIWAYAVRLGGTAEAATGPPPGAEPSAPTATRPIGQSG